MPVVQGREALDDIRQLNQENLVVDAVHELVTAVHDHRAALQRATATATGESPQPESGADSVDTQEAGRPLLSLVASAHKDRIASAAAAVAAGSGSARWIAWEQLEDAATDAIRGLEIPVDLLRPPPDLTPEEGRAAEEKFLMHFGEPPAKRRRLLGDDEPAPAARERLLAAYHLKAICEAAWMARYLMAWDTMMSLSLRNGAHCPGTFRKLTDVIRSADEPDDPSEHPGNTENILDAASIEEQRRKAFEANGGFNSDAASFERQRNEAIAVAAASAAAQRRPEPQSGDTQPTAWAMSIVDVDPDRFRTDATHGRWPFENIRHWRTMAAGRSPAALQKRLRKWVRGVRQTLFQWGERTGDELTQAMIGGASRTPRITVMSQELTPKLAGARTKGSGADPKRTILDAEEKLWQAGMTHELYDDARALWKSEALAQANGEPTAREARMVELDPDEWAAPDGVGPYGAHSRAQYYTARARAAYMAKDPREGGYTVAQLTRLAAAWNMIAADVRHRMLEPGPMANLDRALAAIVIPDPQLWIKHAWMAPDDPLLPQAPWTPEDAVGAPAASATGAAVQRAAHCVPWAVTPASAPELLGRGWDWDGSYVSNDARKWAKNRFLERSAKLGGSVGDTINARMTRAIDLSNDEWWIRMAMLEAQRTGFRLLRVKGKAILQEAATAAGHEIIDRMNSAMGECLKVDSQACPLTMPLPMIKSLYAAASRSPPQPYTGPPVRGPPGTPVRRTQPDAHGCSPHPDGTTDEQRLEKRALQTWSEAEEIPMLRTRREQTRADLETLMERDQQRRRNAGDAALRTQHEAAARHQAVTRTLRRTVVRLDFEIDADKIRRIKRETAELAIMAIPDGAGEGEGHHQRQGPRELHQTLERVVARRQRDLAGKLTRLHEGGVPPPDGTKGSFRAAAGDIGWSRGNLHGPEKRATGPAGRGPSHPAERTSLTFAQVVEASGLAPPGTPSRGFLYPSTLQYEATCTAAALALEGRREGEKWTTKDGVYTMFRDF